MKGLSQKVNSGGTVIVWDEGTYEPIEKIKGKKAQEKHFLHGLYSGSIKELIGDLNFNAVIDGKILVLDDKGLSDFGSKPRPTIF